MNGVQKDLNAIEGNHQNQKEEKKQREELQLRE